MDKHTATEQAYKRGYEDGKQDALKWIPVTERVPDKDGDYLVIKDLSGDPYTDILGFAVDGDKICRFDLSGEKNCFYYYYDGEYISTDNVTHWMPLPQPPKEG